MANISRYEAFEVLFALKRWDLDGDGHDDSSAR
jgi:hypothetical protein